MNSQIKVLEGNIGTVLILRNGVKYLDFDNIFEKKTFSN